MRQLGFGSLLAQLDQAEQNFVALRLQLRDGARSGLGMDAVDEFLLHVRRQHGRAEGLPPSRHRAGELLEEVLDAARTAAEMVQHQAAHDAPAQARAPAQGGVDVGGAHHALGHEVIDFAAQRRLQAVGDVPRHFLVEAHRPLPDRRVKFRCAPDRGFGGLCPADDLRQRDQVGRIERMGDDAALGMGCGTLLDFAHGEPRRARCDDHVGRQQLVELAIELLLEFDPLGPVLLDEVGAGECLRDVGREREVRLRSSGRQAQSLERRPGRLDELPSVLLPRSARYRSRRPAIPWREIASSSSRRSRRCR